MRRLVFALALIGSVSSAAAGELDYPTLRGANMVVPGPANYTRWDGFYAGAFVSYNSANYDFSTSTQDLLAMALRELALESEQNVSSWQVLGKNNNQGFGYGGFVGYNVQWDEAVIGFEFGYTRASLVGIATNFPISRVTSAGGNTYLVNLDGSASMHVNEYFTGKTRFGYVYQNLLPFATVGLALGRGDYSRSATASGTETHPDNTVTPYSFTQSETKTNTLFYGWTAGLGIDVAMLPNVFVRGELEYTRFFPIGNIQVGITTARAALGVKF